MLTVAERKLEIPPLISGGPIEACNEDGTPRTYYSIPPLISGGPIEAQLWISWPNADLRWIPPLISGGPIEAIPAVTVP